MMVVVDGWTGGRPPNKIKGLFTAVFVTRYWQMCSTKMCPNHLDVHCITQTQAPNHLLSPMRPNHYQHISLSLSSRRVCLSCCNHNNNNLAHDVLHRIESFATCINAPSYHLPSSLHSWPSLFRNRTVRSLAPENYYYQRASPSDKETRIDLEGNKRLRTPLKLRRIYQNNLWNYVNQEVIHKIV